MAENKQIAEGSDSGVHKKVKAAFKVFDWACNNTVDVRDVDAIMCSLGCFPSQADINDFKAEVEEVNSGYVSFDKFFPAMTKVLMENKFPPIPEDCLLQAFEVLDKEKKGYLTPEELTEYMKQGGDPFNQEEIDEMLAGLSDGKTNLIYYKNIISKLTIDPDK